jgi:hypothetical protein
MLSMLAPLALALALQALLATADPALKDCSEWRRAQSERPLARRRNSLLNGQHLSHCAEIDAARFAFSVKQFHQGRAA